MKNNGLIKTAQFAKLCNVSKQTLIYYHKMGIFYPSLIDEKGYRYYSISQHNAFMVIAMLRKLDTPLSEIREYLENKGTSSFLELLNKKQNEVSKSIKELKESLQMIEERKSMTHTGINIHNTEEVNIESFPEERIIISDYVNSHKEEDYISVISSLEQYIYENGNKYFSICGIVNKSKLLSEKDYRVTYFYAKTNIVCKNTIIKPKGLYATTFHKGNYDSTYPAYKRLLEYIKINNYVVIGDAYEEVIMDTCTQKSEDEYLTRISILVEKSKC